MGRESDLEVIEEVMQTLFNLTEGMYLPDARWQFLVDRLSDLKNNAQKEFALSLLANSLDTHFLPLLHGYTLDSDPEVATAVEDSIAQIEGHHIKARLAEQLNIVLQPCVQTPLNNAVWKEICKELLPIFNFEFVNGRRKKAGSAA